MNCGTCFACFALLIGSISASIIPRIIGGEDADINVYPYQASLRYKGVHRCGGCIISSRHILTAAHCVTHANSVWPSPDVSISTGTGSSKETGNSHSVEKVTVHPEWVGAPGTSGVNDIAVITIVGEIIFDENQQKIKLPREDVVSRSNGILTGWGRTSTKSSKLSVKLQKLEMRMLNNKDCQKYHYLEVHKEQLCAFHRPGHGSYMGDSGGPIASNDEVVGILSWVLDGHFADGIAEIFTNVYAHRIFIESAMNPESNA